MRRILIAPDSFKGSLTAVEFCRIGAQVIKHHWPDIEVIERPLSDGGEGFVAAITESGQAERRVVDSLDPLARPIQATFGWQADRQTAMIEMAQASGLPLISKQERDPMQASTYGTGLVIKAALELGARTIILGLGGSATNDGGAGALQALGIELSDDKDQPIKPGVQGLLKLDKIGHIPAHLSNIKWHLACDVTNPLLGEQGATTVYGPQKGVTPQTHAEFEQALTKFAELIEQRTGHNITTRPGAGAAGGMAGGFMGILNAQTFSGFDLLAETIGLHQTFEQGVDLVITGEGRMDAQTRHGKLPMKLAEMAQRYDVPILGLCGQLDISAEQMPEFIALFSLIHRLTDEADAMNHTEHWLKSTLYSALKLYLH
ncbi:MAG: glycerate kinase [Thiomicrospira sp.]|uniref:glycerate kinase n=1 Tax=Thiomicrospira sp. TaxID=935 RepID=UPI001A0363CC|nr:glycerate kinase [Thiomicrospira sp.]MBE0493030.1 glycerate kinase [Thiomicrospira sp.]